MDTDTRSDCKCPHHADTRTLHQRAIDAADAVAARTRADLDDAIAAANRAIAFSESRRHEHTRAVARADALRARAVAALNA